EVAAELTNLRAEDPDQGAERFGNYLLVRELGRGGQGVVYLALDERLGRRVALKLLRGQPFGGGEDRLRFQREARIASRLDDPGICTVHETGEVEGTPFIAMGYVEGETLAERIAAAREAGAGQVAVPSAAGATVGDTARVLGIVERVARSLQRAHAAGVIHRDVKPGNVMVTPTGDPVLLDFGLARATDDGQPTLTRTGDVFGTPAYMAPEQVLGDGGEVGPAADVYGLGATLYECLTLHRPFEAPTREALYRAIAMDQPTDPSSVRPGLAADLRLILLTALARDPASRYRSAADMAEDLRRFLVGEPILARPPSVHYRLRRFVGRHRALVVGTSVLVVGLASATTVTTRALFRAQAASARESEERITADRTLEVFEDILSLGSAQSGGREVLLVDVLDRSAPQLEQAFETLPRAGARLMTAFGRVYTGLGELEQAATLLDRAWALHQGRGESETPAALKTRHALGVLLREQAQYEQAQEHLSAVREAYLREQGEDHPDTVRVTLDLAAIWVETGEYARADTTLEALLEGATGSALLDVLAKQSELRMEQGRADEAVEILEDVVRRTVAAVGTDHVDTAAAWNNLAVEYHEHGRFREAGELYERALDVQRRKLGAGSPDTLSTVRNLGFLYKATGEYEDAERLYLEALEAQEAALDPDHPDVLSTVNNLGRLYQATADQQRAEQMLRRAVEAGTRRLGALNPDTLIYRSNL
ncbi:MAG: serine/threonine-protein kinase, partial [Planctomycetota bacterium]